MSRSRKPYRTNLTRGAAPLGLPHTLSRAPLAPARSVRVARSPCGSAGSSLIFYSLASEADEVRGGGDDAAKDRQVAERLQRPLPQAHGQRNRRVARQPIELRLIGI